MPLSRIVVVLASLVALTTGCQSAPTVKLAADGRALLPIVVPPDAAEPIRTAADDLARYLGQITGATFTVEEGDGSRGIAVGCEPLRVEFKQATIAQREYFEIRSEPERLVLTGGSPLAISHAVYRLLHRLGCRWYFPAAEWEVVPRQPDLSIAIDEHDQPAMVARTIWYGYGYFDRAEQRTIPEHQAWRRRNLAGESLRINNGHAWQTIIHERKAEFEAHPEYRALVKGERQGEQLCVSNPGLRQLATEWALAYLKRFPNADMVSMECSDGGGHCECAECAKLGTISDRAFYLANEVARAVARQYPGKMVGMLAYNDHSQPPSFPLEPNVYVQLTRGFIVGPYTFDELVLMWPKVTRNFGLYEYYSVYLWDWDTLPAGRGANVPYIRQSIPWYGQLGATTLSCESGNNWGLHGRGYYVANALMWNPRADVDALLTDFYQQAFGPAAAPVQRYYERLDPGSEPLLSESLIGLALRDLEEAVRLAQARPDVLARLRHLQQFMHFVCLRWQFDHEPDKARQKELALALLTHAYRNRYTYMNHWEAIRQHSTRDWAKRFEEPTWSFSDPTPNKPWAVAEPTSAEQTAAEFAADLARFQPVEVIERSFSSDLVAGAFTATGASLRVGFQGTGEYLLASPAGEPLAWTVTVGIIAWYRDRAPAKLTLATLDGKELLAQTLQLTGEPVALTCAVPAPGLYRLRIVESSTGHTMQTAPGAPAVLPVKRAQHYNSFGHLQELCFLVPAGTTELCYFIANSTPHDLVGPDGKVRFTGERSGVYYRVPIAPADAGRVWRIRRLALGQLWFFNAPNYLAASPAALLVPRELATPTPAR